MFSLSPWSSSERGSRGCVKKKALNASETKKIKQKTFSSLLGLLGTSFYSEGFPSTPLWVSTAGFMEAECVHMDPAERRGSQGSPQVTDRHCRRMWLRRLTRDCWCGPTHPICQCNYSSSVSGSERANMQQWSYEGVWSSGVFPEGRERRYGQQGTALWFLLPLVLFSFSLGSEVLFGLVFGVLVYKHDFCSMGTSVGVW